MIELLLVMFGLSLLIFVISRVLPGDPVRYALGPGATPAQIAQMTREMGFDRPLPEQYVRLMAGALRGDFGTSLVTQRPIATDLAAFLPATLELALVALAIAVGLGVLFGVIAASANGRWPDRLTRVVAFTAVAVPAFWLAILLQQTLAFEADWLPSLGRLGGDTKPPPEITGAYLADSLLAGDIRLFWSSLAHLVLPALVLAISPMAMILRLVRAGMIEQMSQDYVTTARANGLPDNLLTHKYVLRNAFSATLTVVGLLFGYFIGSAFIVETVFSWPGIGRFGVRALQFKDFNAIIAVTLVVGLAYAAANTLVTVLYGWLDPRLRLMGK